MIVYDYTDSEYYIINVNTQTINTTVEQMTTIPFI